MSDEQRKILAAQWREACPDITDREIATLDTLPAWGYATNAAWLLAAYRRGFDDGRHTAVRETRPPRRRHGRGHR